MGAGLNSIWFTVGLVVSPTQARIRCVPTATLVFSEIIAMRDWAIPNLGNYQCLRVPELLSFGVPKIVTPPTI